jgi:tetratricopeptide (TPR) repeat protein
MARSLNLLGVAHNISGHYQQAEHCIEQALTICEALDDRRQMMDILNNLGVIAIARGDYRVALSRYQDALTIAREIGHRDGEIVFLSNLAGARVELEDYQAAESELQRVIQMAGTAGSGGLSDTYYYLAAACLGQGKIAEALDAARQALVLGQAIGEPAFIAAAWRAIGMAASQLHEPITIEDASGEQPVRYDAAACFAESIRICAETGMEGERARTLRAWAIHELEHSDHSRGAAMWHEAREIFARLGAELEAERMAELPMQET